MHILYTVDCSIANGGCDHLCENTVHGPQCTCLLGYDINGEKCIGECVQICMQA